MINEVIINNDIKSKIYKIRGKQVILDSDLAKLYECTNGAKTINQAVKRNNDRFPEDFYFQLTLDEYDLVLSSRSQVGTLNKTGRGSNLKYLPYVFTEQGVAMLASILRTAKSAEVSINIMRTFVEMRKFLYENAEIFERLNYHELKFLKYDDNFNKLFNMLSEKEIKEKKFMDGKIYDAYSLIIDIIKSANKSIIIIDNYIDKIVLDMVSKLDDQIDIKIISKTTNTLDITKYKEQYNNISIKHMNIFHDRFIIIDDKFLYHLGASIKDMGKKCFGINIIEDEKYLNEILEIITK